MPSKLGRKVDEAMRKLFVFPLWAAILWLAAQIAATRHAPRTLVVEFGAKIGAAFSSKPAFDQRLCRGTEFRASPK